MKIKLVSFLLMAVFLLSSCSSSTVKIKSGQPKKTFVLVTEEYPPYQFVNLDDEADGSDVKIAEAAAKAAGVQIIIKFMSWEDCVNMVQLGMADGVIGMIQNEKRKEFALFPVTNISISKIGIFTSPEFKKSINSVKDLNSTMVGVVDGYAYTPEFDASTEIQKVKFKDLADLVKGLVDGKVPIIVGNEQAISYYLEMYKTIYPAKKAFISQIASQNTKLGTSPRYLAISKLSPKADEAFRAFSDALLEIQDSGEMQRIKKMYNK